MGMPVMIGLVLIAFNLGFVAGVAWVGSARAQRFARRGARSPSWPWSDPR